MAFPRALERVSPAMWKLPLSYKDGMRVPARIMGTEKLIQQMDEAVFDQISNVAALPGIVRYALCMPDGHYGYEFPIGGVAPMDEISGVISPGISASISIVACAWCGRTRLTRRSNPISRSWRISLRERPGQGGQHRRCGDECDGGGSRLHSTSRKADFQAQE